MPIYEYQARDKAKCCDHCRDKFEVFGKASEPPLAACPRCDSPVYRLISACSVGASKSGLDARAKSSGFHKLVKRDKGVYEKSY